MNQKHQVKGIACSGHIYFLRLLMFHPKLNSYLRG